MNREEALTELANKREQIRDIFAEMCDLADEHGLDFEDPVGGIGHYFGTGMDELYNIYYAGVYEGDEDANKYMDENPDLNWEGCEEMGGMDPYAYDPGDLAGTFWVPSIC